VIPQLLSTHRRFGHPLNAEVQPGCQEVPSFVQDVGRSRVVGVPFDEPGSHQLKHLFETLSPQLLGPEGFRGAQGFRRSRLEWLGDNAPCENRPRPELDTLGPILRRNFAIRGSRTAALPDHSWLPSSGGRLLVCSNAQNL